MEPLPSGKDYLSPSQISLVLTCGAKWRYRYVEGLPDPGSLATVTGQAMHATLEKFLLTRQEDPEATMDGVRDHAWEAFQAALGDAREKYGVRDGDDPDEVVAAARQTCDLAEAAVAWAAEHIESVVAVERQASYPLADDVSVMGYYDALVVIGGRLTLLDWKTAARSPSIDSENGTYILERKYALQLLQYARALQGEGIVVEDVAAIVVTKTKTVRVCPAVRAVEPDHIRFAERIAHSALATIRMGALEPNPFGAGFLCSPKYCSFWSVCPGHDPADDPDEVKQDA